MNRYLVQAFDREGEFASTGYFASFAECLRYVTEFAQYYQGKVIKASNVDRADLDFDGLTDEERDRVQLTIDAAREDSREWDGGRGNWSATLDELGLTGKV